MAILNGKKIMLIGLKGAGDGSDITVDSKLSNTSENPVQNKVVTEALDGKLDKFNGDGATYSLYAVYPDGTQKNIPYSVGAIVNSVVCRNEDGTFFVQEPVNGGNPATKRFAENLFNGANKAVSFVNYSLMIASLNALPNTSYTVGQNIYIRTLNVPDLWVSRLTTDSVPYTYVSDTDFVEELNANGSVQVGYYTLSALETQKVDLTDYYDKEEVDTKLDGKVEKYDGSPYNDKRRFTVYGQELGEEKNLPFSNKPTDFAIVQYTSGGRVLVNDPKEENSATNKKFVESLVSSHLDEFHKQSEKYENITISDMYQSGYVSKTELPNPKKIRIESLDICKVYNEEVGGAQEYYGLATPQTFSITPDSNGYFSVDVNANVYKGWEYNEEFGDWMPSEDNTPIEENVPLTLNFKFSFEDVAGDGVNKSLIFCYNLINEINDSCTVSLYIIPDESLVTYKELDEKVGTIETTLDTLETDISKLQGGTYELIDTITTTEDMTTISLSNEPNGNAYSFKDVFVKFNWTGTVEKRWILLGITAGGKMVDGFTTLPQYTGNATSWIRTINVYGHRLFLFSYLSTNLGNALSLSMPINYCEIDKPITAIKIQREAAFPAGVKIEVWGVRA